MLSLECYSEQKVDEIVQLNSGTNPINLLYVRYCTDELKKEKKFFLTFFFTQFLRYGISIELTCRILFVEKMDWTFCTICTVPVPSYMSGLVQLYRNSSNTSS